MSVLGGTQGHWRKALRAGSLGLVAVLGLFAIAPAGGLDLPSAHIQLSGSGTSGWGRTDADSSSQVVSPGPTAKAFGITGRVKGLFPGHSTRLVLKVTNREGFAIVVTRIATTVKKANAGCTAANLSVSVFSGHLSVRPHGSAKTKVRARMATKAPNRCSAATFPLVYRGVAKKR